MATFQNGVKFLIAEVSKIRHLTVKILSADFAAASKNSGKNLCCLLKIDCLVIMCQHLRFVLTFFGAI